MSARILDGVTIGKAIREEVAAEVARFRSRGRKPGLAAVLVGEDPASAVYVRSKGKACEEAGMHSVTIRLPVDAPEDRKSTRLNSSHMSISYAVFCLKKKKKNTNKKKSIHDGKYTV